jgi:Ca2+/Na+ antiporter
METNTPAILGALIGGAIGVAGGIVGTYFSIKNTKTQAEKEFMIRSSIVVWIAVTLFGLLMWLIPFPYNHLLWIPYALALGFGIPYANKKQQEFRESSLNERFTPKDS